MAFNIVSPHESCSAAIGDCDNVTRVSETLPRIAMELCRDLQRTCCKYNK